MRHLYYAGPRYGNDETGIQNTVTKPEEARWKIWTQTEW